jgi:CubicO group peptidase (beta-lactamase class C family)
MKFTLIALLLFISPFLYASKKQGNAVDKIFAEWSKPGAPGAAVGVIKDGKLIYAKGYGLANLEYDIPNDADSVFRIASTSKQFTAACIVLLAERGELNLTDTLDKFLPDFPDYAKDITIRHLLNHTSGIRDYLTLADLKGLGVEDYYQDKDVISWLVNQTELSFPPGEEYLYSNSGYWLLGKIVEQVAGMNMAEFAEQEIFKPLNMAHTHFHNNHKKIVRKRASGYTPTNGDSYEISMTSLDMIGDGGIFTTINDIKKWDDAFYQSSVLSPEFWQEMSTQGVLNNGEQISYASGLIIDDYKGLKTVSHGGAFVGFRAELLRFPEQKFTVAIFANRGDTNPSVMAYRVADVFLNKLYSAEKIEDNAVRDDIAINPTLEAIKLTNDQLLGMYELKAGFQLKVTMNNEKLHAIQSWNSNEYDLNPSEKPINQFQIGEDKSLTFDFSNLNDKQAQIMTVFQDGVISTWKRVKAFDLTGINLNDFVGNFYSKELDVVHGIRINDDKLTVQLGKMDPLTLDFSTANRVYYQGNYIDFERKNGMITGFKMTAGRVKNLSFFKQ